MASEDEPEPTSGRPDDSEPVSAPPEEPEPSSTSDLPDDQGQFDAPEGRFINISVGIGHACGLRIDRSIVCWGGDNIGAASVPEGPFTAVSAG